jgi:hypothetical protein
MTNIKAGDIVLARNKKLDEQWYGFIVSFHDVESGYVAMESRGHWDDYEGYYKQDGIEIRIRGWLEGETIED